MISKMEKSLFHFCNPENLGKKIAGFRQLFFFFAKKISVISFLRKVKSINIYKKLLREQARSIIFYKYL